MRQKGIRQSPQITMTVDHSANEAGFPLDTELSTPCFTTLFADHNMF